MPSRNVVTYCLLPLLTVAAARANDQAGDEDGPPSTAELTRVEIVGNPQNVPGAASYIGRAALDAFLYSDTMRVLRFVPGVYIQDEEGYGLRPNIGIRGSGLDRSSRVALLEDKVLIAPAPYASPSAYYFPTQRRMDAVEVLKGPAAIAVGPRTTGGAINFVSRPIPTEHSGSIDALVGDYNSYDVDAYYGGSTEHLGWFVETVQQKTTGFKDLDGRGNQDTGFDLGDYVAKFRLNTDYSSGNYQGVEIKLGYTEQLSHASYLGLTDEDFANGPYRRYAGSQIDNIDSNHEQYQLTYFLQPQNANWDIAVTAYRHDFKRNWYKLQSVNGSSISSILRDPASFMQEMDWIRGATSPGDALVLRNNNRTYYSQGIQSFLDFNFDLGGVHLDLGTGVRFHEDEEDRFQDEDGYRMDNGLMVLTSDGAPGSQTNRVSDAKAGSVFVKGDIYFGDWLVSPGLRYEDLTLTRNDYATNDPSRANGPTRVRTNDIKVFIPGVGALYAVGSRWSVLGGIYKGYNPPAPGSTSREESSVAYELGSRFAEGALSAEMVWFYNDYDNLVGTVTASTGGNGQIGDQFDAGQARVSGLEMSLSHGGFEAFGASGLSIPLRVAYTYTPVAEFQTSFDSSFDPWGDVQRGDRLPYLPLHQGQVATGVVGNGWDVLLNLLAQDKTRTVAGQGAILPAEATDRYFVVDLAARYSFGKRISGFARIDNLFDETFIVARRPAGVRPGRPRTAMIGVLVDFGQP